MKPSLRIALAIGIALLVSIAIIALRPKPEPKYNGKPLSKWLDQLVANYPRIDPGAVQALNGMGAEAVRSLTVIVDDQDSPLATQLLQYSGKMPLLAEMVPSKLWRRFVAVKALAEMGTNATAAIPSLQRLIGTNDYTLAPAAGAALVLIQNDSIEALAEQAFDPAKGNSPPAFGLLLQLGAHGKPAIPRVVSELQSTNEHVRLRAAIILQHIGIESPECLPVFLSMLADTNHLLHAVGIHALANCGNLATSTAPSVVELLGDSQSNCRHAVLNYLWRVVPPESFEPFRAAVQRLLATAIQMCASRRRRF